MNAAPILWQRPRPKAEPSGFAERVETLHKLLATIAGRHAHAALASSLSAEDVVLTHAIATLGVPIEIFVIDTGRLHRQTLALVATLEQRFGTVLRIHRPDAAAVVRHVDAHGEFGFYDSLEVRKDCCHLRKVEPLDRALAGRDAWLTGQRRAHGPDRARLAEQERDEARGIAKYNPLALWSDDDVWHYTDRHELPFNALYAKGYPSIGCEPCTRAVRADEHARAGRWWWEQGHSKECGLHTGPRHSTIPVSESA